jgi:hypothetical protein
MSLESLISAGNQMICTDLDIRRASGLEQEREVPLVAESTRWGPGTATRRMLPPPRTFNLASALPLEGGAENNSIID